jgi:hypothetical protein
MGCRGSASLGSGVEMPMFGGPTGWIAHGRRQASPGLEFLPDAEEQPDNADDRDIGLYPESDRKNGNDREGERP